MGLSGTLETLSLPNLIQLHCQQLQPAQVRINRRAQQGTLAFSNGELIYASTGALNGEDAVSEMLSWESGDFQVDDKVTSLPPRNVNVPWSMLMLDSLHRIDEQRAERSAAGEVMLKESKQRKEFRDGVLVTKTGEWRAEATDRVPEEDGALVALIANRAQAVGDMLGLGTFDQMLSTRAGEKLFIERVGEDYLGCWLDEKTSLDPVKNLAKNLKQGK
jgi:hypothetical protein